MYKRRVYRNRMSENSLISFNLKPLNIYDIRIKICSKRNHLYNLVSLHIYTYT